MIRVLELFAGIGACSKALTNLGIDHEIVDAVEIDKYAIKSFNAVHGTNFEPQDIRDWDKDIKCDLILHGSPCQDFSIAGRQAGGDEGSGTRSSLLYESLCIIEKTNPKYVIWENVRNLMSARHKPNWDRYCERMEEMGYRNTAKILNAKDYGIPQNRERVYTVSIRNDITGEFNFPEPRPLEKKLKDILDDDVDEKYYLSDAQVDSLVVQSDKQQAKGNGFKFKPRELDGTATTISTRAGGRKTDNFIQLPSIVESHLPIRTANSKGYDLAQNGDGIDLAYPSSNTRRGRVGHGVAKTLATSDNQGTLDGFRIRKLTPKECWRLMGFDDSDFEKAEKVNSNTQLYKQAGNSIVVKVLEEIFKNLMPEEVHDNG